jgi:hypothetical protein
MYRVQETFSIAMLVRGTLNRSITSDYVQLILVSTPTATSALLQLLQSCPTFNERASLQEKILGGTGLKEYGERCTYLRYLNIGSSPQRSFEEEIG